MAVLTQLQEEAVQEPVRFFFKAPTETAPVGRSGPTVTTAGPGPVRSVRLLPVAMPEMLLLANMFLVESTTLIC